MGKSKSNSVSIDTANRKHRWEHEFVPISRFDKKNYSNSN